MAKSTTLPAGDEYSDCESRSSSSISHRSSLSVSSPNEKTSSFSPIHKHKPHKANQAEWQEMRRLIEGEKGGSVGIHNFRLLRRVGEGDIGTVYLCQVRSMPPRCFYAMKVVDREEVALRKKLQRAETEKEILGLIDHPFLPTLYAEFDTSRYSCLVMEFCPGGDLHAARIRQPRRRFSISATKFYAAEVLLALEYLHMMGIIYRDLKPENVLVREDGHIMLSDFDLSLKCDVVPELFRPTPKCEHLHNHKSSAPSPCSSPVLSCFSNFSVSERGAAEKITKTTPTHFNALPELVAEPVAARSKSFVGTHEYLAPEVIFGHGHGSPVDWWAFGVFLYELLFGTTPFKGDNNERTLMNILRKPLSFPGGGGDGNGGRKEFEEMVSVRDLISKLLVKNPEKRIGSLKGSSEIKRHEFFEGVNWALIRSVKPPQVPVDKIGKMSAFAPKLSKQEGGAPFQRSHHFDYF